MRQYSTFKWIVASSMGLACPVLLAADGAQAGGQAGNPLMSNMVMIFVLFAMMYFLLIRPQSKKAKEHRALLDSLTTGDEVVTTGGLVGKIARVADNFFVLTIADGVEVPVQKQAVTLALPKGTLKSI